MIRYTFNRQTRSFRPRLPIETWEEVLVWKMFRQGYDTCAISDIQKMDEWEICLLLDRARARSRAGVAQW